MLRQCGVGCSPYTPRHVLVSTTENLRFFLHCYSVELEVHFDIFRGKERARTELVYTVLNSGCVKHAAQHDLDYLL